MLGSGSCSTNDGSSNLKTVDVGDFILTLDDTLLLVNRYTGVTLKAKPDVQSVCSLLTKSEELHELLMKSKKQLKEHMLITSVKFGPFTKEICIEFTLVEKTFEEQRNDLLTIVDELKQKVAQLNNQLKTKVAQLNNELETKVAQYDNELKRKEKKIQELKSWKEEVCQNYKDWNETHCGGCAKPIQQAYRNAYGRPTCSLQCSNYVENTLRWIKTVDIGL